MEVSESAVLIYQLDLYPLARVTYPRIQPRTLVAFICALLPRDTLVEGHAESGIAR